MRRALILRCSTLRDAIFVQHLLSLAPKVLRYFISGGNLSIAVVPCIDPQCPLPHTAHMRRRRIRYSAFRPPGGALHRVQVHQVNPAASISASIMAVDRNAEPQ